MAELVVRQGRVTFETTGGAIEWASAGAPAAGQVDSGDRDVIVAVGGGALLGVVDALGHGPEASEVADTVVAVLHAGASDELQNILLRCHRELAGSRGAVLALARFESIGTLSWLGVGNVKALLLRPRYGTMQACATVVAHAGVLGMQLPPIRSQSIAVRPEDVLVMASDGVGAVEMEREIWANLPAATAGIVKQHRVPSDDSILLAARLSRGRAS